MVAQVTRGYLPRTETFIANQINNLPTSQPIVVAHHLVAGLDAGRTGVITPDRVAGTAARLVDSWTYRLGRTMGPGIAARLARSIKRNNAALLHFHFLTDARFMLDLKRKTGLPALASAYGYDVSTFPRRFLGLGRLYLQPVFAEMDLVVAMTAIMRRDLLALGCPEHKITVHYHGIDTARFSFPDRAYEDKEVVEILACGRLTPGKGPDLTLRALRHAEQNGMLARRFRITFVGAGPMRAALEQQVTEYGWGSRVAFTGFIDHRSPLLVNAYHNADLFTLPCVTVGATKEGLPGTLAEAMAAGLPVVSSRHGGIVELIAPGANGLLVAEGDVVGLAAALAAVINSSALRRELGVAAASYAARNLDVHRSALRLEELYSILAG